MPLERGEEHDPCPAGGDGVRDIGHGVRIRLWRRGGEPIGLFESHDAPGGERCSGSLLFAVPASEGLPGPRWLIEAWDPLTLQPTIRCTACGHHGFIRGGRWVPF